MKVSNIWGTSSGFVKAGLFFLLISMTSCRSQQASNTISEPKLYQSWQLKQGDQIEGTTVIGGLGDISIALNGKSVHAPSAGKAYVDKRGCVYFEGADTPAYLFRLCGLKSPKLGVLKAGETIGTGDTLQFAALLKQSNDTWALVEPDKSLLKRTLQAR